LRIKLHPLQLIQILDIPYSRIGSIQVLINLKYHALSKMAKTVGVQEKGARKMVKVGHSLLWNNT
jgi:hypothetical protein